MIIRGIMNANQNGVYQDPEDENLFYIAKRYGEEKIYSTFLTPALSRFFIIPEEIRLVLIENGAVNIDLNKDGKKKESYARYRGLWASCPYCSESDICATVYLKRSNIHITHCYNFKEFAFGISKHMTFLRSVRLTHIGDKEVKS